MNVFEDGDGTAIIPVVKNLAEDVDIASCRYPLEEVPANNLTAL